MPLGQPGRYHSSGGSDSDGREALGHQGPCAWLGASRAGGGWRRGGKRILRMGDGRGELSIGSGMWVGTSEDKAMRPVELAGPQISSRTPVSRIFSAGSVKSLRWGHRLWSQK